MRLSARLYLSVLFARVNSVKEASVTWKFKLVGRKMSQKIRMAKPIITTRATMILKMRQKRVHRQLRPERGGRL